MSWIEVETKIPISDGQVSDVRKRIKEISKFIKRENKKDDYYSLEYFSYPTKSLRIRDKGKVKEVNFKKRHSYLNGVYAKNEVQFEISDTSNFINLIEDFGFRKWLHKEKITELYRTANGVSIELNKVKGLGYFLELEVLCPLKQVASARKKIIDTRLKLGFSQKDSEERGYTKQLWDKK
ncbi:MAG: class IV adenylate cyclase [Candidatus Pacearchaeota archaeon]